MTTPFAPPSAAAQAEAPIVLRIADISKSYGKVQAVKHVSLDVRRGEVLTLLGPSGCGKTTTLRLVIGLERCDDGELVYGERVLDAPRRRTFVPTHKREMGIVFQSYAIWPHMTVFENVAYPLRVRKVKGSRVKELVGNALELVGLAGYEERPATMLSGGQQQRVAVARGLVFEPQILLLDEPFSNLDAKLREQMRADLKVLQRRLGITVLFVTHDQIEALSLSDRMAVMNVGIVEQVGTPQELYHNPATPHVRDFLGKTILFDGQVEATRGEREVAVRLKHGGYLLTGRNHTGAHLTEGMLCWAAVRPEQVSVEPTGDATNSLPAEIEALLFIGDRYEARVRFPWGESVLVYLPAVDRWREGQRVSLVLPAEEVRVWPA